VNGPRDRRLRIEHDFVISDADAERQARLGVIAAVQPAFCCSDVGHQLRPQRSDAIGPGWHTLLTDGVDLAMSSGLGRVCGRRDPFVNMQQAVTRQIWRSPDIAGIETAPFDGARQAGAVPQAGKIYYPEERISRARSREWLHARARHERHISRSMGGYPHERSIRGPGGAVAGHFLGPASDIGKTRALLTMVGGKIVFDSEQLGPVTTKKNSFLGGQGGMKAVLILLNLKIFLRSP